MKSKAISKIALFWRVTALVLSVHSTVAMAATEFAVSAQAGYRQDSLDWNIADVDGNPNVLSELTWSDLRIFQAQLDLAVTIKQLTLFGKLGYGDIVDGKNQDSDYDANNRQLEFSRSNNQAGGDVADASLGIGYIFKAGRTGSFHRYIMPMAGYSIHQQNLTMTDGFQTIPAFGSFDGLNSSYDTQWNGPWIGFSFWSTDTVRDLTIAIDFAYHQADYHAEATWNLRTTGPLALAQPKSFEHWANGQGVSLSFKSDYGLSKRWDFIMGLDYRLWKTDPGLDRVYPATGGSLETRLNQVNWQSVALNVGVRWTLGH